MSRKARFFYDFWMDSVGYHKHPLEETVKRNRELRKQRAEDA